MPIHCKANCIDTAFRAHARWRNSYELKTPYKNGTTHVLFEPLDFIARLVALVPKPRFHLTRFHGVFAPNSKHRAEVTGEANEKQNKSTTESSRDVEEGRSKMSWAMRLKRVFNIDITVCRHCQGRVRIIACIVILPSLQ